LIYLIYIKEAAMRVLVDIPEGDLELMDEIRRKRAVSRAEFIRRAIAASLTPYRARMNHAGFGAWAQTAEDGLAYQERMREEW
jgi:metal-responsive CopG/Arc/MetJ family transcriptional regulator